jgi:peptidyl-tRNA hydrolase, PTH1 family
MNEKTDIKVIIGLGNPGSKLYSTRHSIGFRVIDQLGQDYKAVWKQQDNLEYATIVHNDRPYILIKPLTYMNDSGTIIPFLLQQGIKPDNILVIHDELQLSFGKMKISKGGSARGHNGLRSIIAVIGPEFNRLRFGIGRPKEKDQVPKYVLTNFSEAEEEVNEQVVHASKLIQEFLQ